MIDIFGGCEGIVRYLSPMAAVAIAVLIAGNCQGQKFEALLTGQVDEVSNPLIKWFREEPLVDATSVPTRPGGLVHDRDIKRFVRIYFPRSYGEVKDYEFIMLHSPVMYHLEQKHAVWMHDAIEEGSSSLSAPACMSAHPDIHNAWVGSVLSSALPNDCAAVISAGGPEGKETFHIIVNRDFPEPILTPFIDLGIEKFIGYHAFRIIPRQGVRTVAWQIGGFSGRVPYMATWEYGEGRTMTLGDSFGLAFWSDYAGRASQNEYGLDILMNMVLYLIKREVPTDVLVFHRMRTTFTRFRTEMSLLISLAEFAQRFGASDAAIEEVVDSLREQGELAEELYMNLDFEESQRVIGSAFEEFEESESRIKRLKERALMWVYLIEWMVVTATIMLSGYLVWSIMVRRRLYREVSVTRLEHER